MNVLIAVNDGSCAEFGAVLRGGGCGFPLNKLMELVIILVGDSADGGDVGLLLGVLLLLGGIIYEATTWAVPDVWAGGLGFFSVG